MFGFIKGLFTSSPDKVFEAAAGVGSWIDEQQFTEQEKSQANFKALGLQTKMAKRNTRDESCAAVYCHDVLYNIPAVVYCMPT